MQDAKIPAAIFISRAYAVTGSLGINQGGDNVFCLKRIPVVFNKNKNHFLTRLKIAASGLWSFLFNRIGKNLR